MPKMSIQFQDGPAESIELMKQEFKKRLIENDVDYFAIIEETNENMVVSFIPSVYNFQQEFIESFKKEVLEPAVKVSKSKQA